MLRCLNLAFWFLVLAGQSEELGTKYGCISNGEVTLSNLCPNPSTERPYFVSAEYGSFNQIFRHVCPSYPTIPDVGWPICTNNSDDETLSRISERCNFASSCQFEVNDVFPPEELRCFTGQFMYFQLQVQCSDAKTVCAPLNKNTFWFSGAKSGERSYALCPDFEINGNRASEKCLGRDAWDSVSSSPCPQTLFNRAVMTLIQSNGNADEISEGKDLLNRAVRNESLRLTALDKDSSFFVTAADKIDFRGFRMNLNLGRVNFFETSAPRSWNFPRMGLPRLIFYPSLVQRGQSCKAPDYTISFGTVDLTSYTDVFDIELRNSDVLLLKVTSDDACEMQDDDYAQNVTFEILAFQAVKEGYRSQCVVWSGKETLNVSACKTESVTGFVIRCSCSPKTSAFFALTQVELPPPTTTTPAATPVNGNATDDMLNVTDATTPSSSSSTVDLSNSTSNNSTTERSSNEESSADPDYDFKKGNGTMDHPVDIQWLMFSAGCLFHSTILFSIPVTLVAKRLLKTARYKCYEYWFKSPQTLSEKAKKKSNVDQIDAEALVEQDFGQQTGSNKRSAVKGDTYRALFVVYGPFSVTMAAFSTLVLFVSSLIYRQESIEAEGGFVLVILCVLCAWFLAFFGFLFETFDITHSWTKVSIPLVSAAILAFIVAALTDYDKPSFNFTWFETNPQLLACFLVLVCLLVGLLILSIWKTSSKPEDSDGKMLKLKVCALWLSYSVLLMPLPVALAVLVSDWSITCSAVFLLVNFVSPILIVATALGAYFTELHHVNPRNKDDASKAYKENRTFVLQPMDESGLPGDTSLSSNSPLSDINANETDAVSTKPEGKGNGSVGVVQANQSEA